MHHCPECEKAREHGRIYCDQCLDSKKSAYCTVGGETGESRNVWVVFGATLLLSVTLSALYSNPVLLILFVFPIVTFAISVERASIQIAFSILIAVYAVWTHPIATWQEAIPYAAFPAIGLLLGRVGIISRRSHRSRVEYEELFMNSMLSLAKSLDARDPYTAYHSRHVAAYGSKIAAELGFPKRDQEGVYLGGLLHDIGKIATPEAILHKEGALTNEEFEQIKKHPVDGFEIVQNIDRLNQLGVTDMIRHHHEKVNGKGYPDRLQGEQIPLSARILCVSDAFDAMTTNRSYRQKLSPDSAVQELERHAGTQFDPSVVKAFIHVLRREGVILPEESNSAYGSAALQKTS
jgi:putative nucleotidyltransferase with HDIG domain